MQETGRAIPVGRRSENESSSPEGRRNARSRIRDEIKDKPLADSTSGSGLTNPTTAQRRRDFLHFRNLVPAPAESEAVVPDSHRRLPSFGDLKCRAKNGIEVPDGVPESTEVLDGDSYLCLLGLSCAIFHDAFRILRLSESTRLASASDASHLAASWPSGHCRGWSNGGFVHPNSRIEIDGEAGPDTHPVDGLTAVWTIDHFVYRQSAGTDHHPRQDVSCPLPSRTPPRPGSPRHQRRRHQESAQRPRWTI